MKPLRLSWFTAMSVESAPDARPESDPVVADHISRGNAFEDSGDVAKALELYDRAMAIAPDYAPVHVNRGNALARAKRAVEAAAAYRRAMELQPELPSARFNLAGLLASSGDAGAAENLLRELLQRAPDFVDAEVALALVLESSGRIAEAEQCLRRALDRNPKFAGAALNLGQMLTGQGRFDEALDYLAAARAVAPGSLSWMLFSLNHRADLRPAEVHALHVRAGNIITHDAGAAYTSWPSLADSGKRLKIGYVSADFRMHPLGMLIKPLLEHHDDAVVDVHCYSDTTTPDDVTGVLRAVARNWHDVSGLRDDQFAELVRDHQIDILVDLTGHGGRNRMPVFARHPAPVQATWLAYLNTSGLAAMDFRICDAYTDPPGETESLNTETLIRLPNCQWCYDPWWAPKLPAPLPRESTRVRFGSVNSSAKISESCVDLWAELLSQEPTIDLTLCDVSNSQRSSMLARFEARGVEAARIDIIDRQSVDNYYRIIESLDVAVDTFPYNGATTTLDTLWMGTPLVAFKGDRAIARGAYSIFMTVGLRELIAYSTDDWLQLNAALARDPEWRTMLRTTLPQRLAASPLMDTLRFTRDFEVVLRTMWQRWCAQC